MRNSWFAMKPMIPNKEEVIDEQKHQEQKEKLIKLLQPNTEVPVEEPKNN